MLEKAIEKKLKDRVSALGALCLKLECPGFTGVPDRLILLPGGIAVFAETKRPGEKERPRQEYVQRQLRELGFTVFSSVDSADDISKVVRVCLRYIALAKTVRSIFGNLWNSVSEEE